MRIVAVADTHLFHDELSVPDGDVFVHAGDLCRGGDLDELAIAASWIRSLPHAAKIVVPGNHDWAFARESEHAAARELLGSGVIYLQDAGTTLGGLTFWGSPWQPEFCDWAFNLPRGEALAARWALVPEKVDVLITHGPPLGIGDRSGIGRRRSGCADLAARIAVVRPRLHLFGHIHEDGGLWTLDGTCFANVTTWECERAPTIVEIEPGKGDVRAVVVPPRGR